ncbi:Uncharacterised protein [Mycobacterium tuberculosis]|uniref:Uncharacterized protein n=1 Tax=Mycobacterium tuberculosis TaxID=1773 RepID=A0A655DA55_MYCTX|nr:hypothetical protein MRGA327_15150 [Mycobacterium tuberculosis RGTB327]CFK14938.1 Uncharacterised protein [Mycobacterium tuberculosis]CFR70737.1 Uncharacterised protein [Mycobacterium tuberculosis]CKR35693.1 Uncharacterised protein [Mycobacterium tuberculosis]CKR95344.1 Uncharacterised protein [Mycobacterium tuberculosis]
MIAANAGAKTELAIPVTACSTEMEYKPANSGIATAAAVTSTAPATTSARLAVVRSTRAPIGVWATMAAMPPTAMTNPIEA